MTETTQVAIPWLVRMCPVCTQRMRVRRMRAKTDEKTGHLYVKTQYYCLDCGVRESSEIPRRIAASLVGGEEHLPALQSQSEDSTSEPPEAAAS